MVDNLASEVEDMPACGVHKAYNLNCPLYKTVGVYCGCLLCLYCQKAGQLCHRRWKHFEFGGGGHSCSVAAAWGGVRGSS